MLHADSSTLRATFFDDGSKLPAAARRGDGPAARRDPRALRLLCEVGLGYLTLDRQSRTLSGGEVQRINLTTALGTSLVNTLFVLDEPSIGLHPRDMRRVIDVMQRLRDAGNSLVVVEHDPQIMLAADRILDMGPGAGRARRRDRVLRHARGDPRESALADRRIPDRAQDRSRRARRRRRQRRGRQPSRVARMVPCATGGSSCAACASTTSRTSTCAFR